MVRSVAKIASLLLLLIGIAASQTAVFVGLESNSILETISLADANSDTDADDPEFLLIVGHIADHNGLYLCQDGIERYSANLFQNTPLTIRAPPRTYL